MWAKYIDQEWCKEESEIYEDELEEVCENLNCVPDEVLCIMGEDSEEDFEFIEKITGFITGKIFNYNGESFYATSNSGLVTLFKKQN